MSNSRYPNTAIGFAQWITDAIPIRERIFVGLMDFRAALVSCVRTTDRKTDAWKEVAVYLACNLTDSELIAAFHSCGWSYDSHSSVIKYNRKFEA